MNRMRTPAIIGIAAPAIAGIAALGVTAVNANAGHTTTSPTTARYSVAGDTTAGDTTAGDTTAGDTTAGDTTAGDTTAGPAPTTTRETGSAQQKLTAAQREKAELAERKAKVTKVVLKEFPHAQILRVVLQRNGTWTVDLRLHDHRVGSVIVDRHLHVGKFVQLPTKTTAPQPSKTAYTPTPTPSPTATTLYGKHW